MDAHEMLLLEAVEKLNQALLEARAETQEMRTRLREAEADALLLRSSNQVALATQQRRRAEAAEAQRDEALAQVERLRSELRAVQPPTPQLVALRAGARPALRDTWTYAQRRDETFAQPLAAIRALRQAVIHLCELADPEGGPYG